MTDSNRPKHDQDWQNRYQSMIATPDEAVARIRSGDRVFVGTGCGKPAELLCALCDRAKSLVDIEIVHLLTFGEAPYANEEIARHFRVNSFFVSDNVREIIQEGLGDYTPINLSDIPRLFSSGQLPLDVALIHVSPPDEDGKCSFGVSVDIVKSAAANANLVIAQVNPNMPRTLGDSFINVYDLDVLVPVESPLYEYVELPADETRTKIAEYAAGLVEDGATVEVGISAICQTVLHFLKDKRDLGIHTEMFSDSLLDLIDSGAVTGSRKTIDRGKVVASFCAGTERLYRAVNNNPLFYFGPTEYVNDASIIAEQHKQVAINAALEVDLSGQVCADSLGPHFHSGIGGQVDFNRGAARSRGGKAIIALASTTDDGSTSRIVARLSPGAGVVTTRGEVHYIVTEHGVAHLHGKCVQERAIALISIAHPKFRDDLLREAIALHYVRPELADVEGKLIVGPPEFKTTFILDDGSQIYFRPVHPTDESALRDLFHALSQETVYYRFMSSLTHIPTKQMRNFVFINHRTDVAIVGTVPEAYGEDIVCIGRYYLDEKTNLAEVAFVVRDDWQNRGIGTFMLKHLANIARRNGIRGFTAEVLQSNQAMQTVFNKCEYQVTSSQKEDSHSYVIEFT